MSQSIIKKFYQRIKWRRKKTDDNKLYYLRYEEIILVENIKAHELGMRRKQKGNGIFIKINK